MDFNRLEEVAQLPELPDYVLLLLQNIEMQSWSATFKQLASEVQQNKKTIFSFRLLLDYIYGEVQTFSQYGWLLDISFCLRDLARLFLYRKRYWRAKKICMDVATKINSRRNKLCTHEWLLGQVHKVSVEKFIGQEKRLELTFFLWSVNRQNEVVEHLCQHQEAVSYMLSTKDIDAMNAYRKRFLA